ncbi:excisionase [Candidatus Shapirobacteria bacterium CG07_land_8_20_14_0_80_39_18]|uniref:Excisionase n=1 Tax=Candidatus Shapirobacteria bacterium CG07_land_8_20_14_0_80_39_18 TaxID=1974882 RepID=A0A2M6YRI9_9BACT|nr:MAG: excisionase [Candidatus Shapirobacteria bacterium CG07_land_8_20_14_0_80_39_18]
MDKNRRFLTPSEVAKELQLNLLTIYKYIRNRKLSAIKFGRNYRIAERDLEKFIESKKTF